MGAPALVTVERAGRGKPLVRLRELPQALHGGDPRWVPPVMAWERYRLDTRRHPYFDAGDGELFLARRMGRPAGRIVAHVPGHGEAEGRFGFWWLEDDHDLAVALLDAAREWLADQGCTAMVGPLSYGREEEAGVQVAGHGRPGATGRPWHPPHLAALLDRTGARPVDDHPTWRLDLTDPLVASAARPPGAASTVGDAPGHAGPYGDSRLVLPGIAAVPDVSAALRSAGIRSAWSLAKRARARAWDLATVVRCDGDPSELVPGVLHAAAEAGYRTVIAPWTPDPTAPPDAIHRTYRITW